MNFNAVMSSVFKVSPAFLCTLMAKKTCSPLNEIRLLAIVTKPIRFCLGNLLKGKKELPSLRFVLLSRKNSQIFHQWRWHLFTLKNDPQNADEPTSDAVLGARPVAAIQHENGLRANWTTESGYFLTKNQTKKAGDPALMPCFPFAPLRFFTCLLSFCSCQ